MLISCFFFSVWAIGFGLSAPLDQALIKPGLQFKESISILQSPTFTLPKEILASLRDEEQGISKGQFNGDDKQHINRKPISNRRYWIQQFEKMSYRDKLTMLENRMRRDFPFYLCDNITIIDYLDTGSGGVIYEASHENYPGRPIIFKIFKIFKDPGGDDFENEYNVLNMLGRLILYQKNPWVLVYFKIQGKTLHQIIKENNNQEIYKKEYQALSGQFYDETGYIHGDIRPQNVILDEQTGALNLIDFGRSFKPDKNADFYLRKDLDYAMHEYDFTLFYLRMKDAYNTAFQNYETLQTIEDFIDMLCNNPYRKDQALDQIKKYVEHLINFSQTDRLRTFKYSGILERYDPIFWKKTISHANRKSWIDHWFGGRKFVLNRNSA